MGSVTRLKDHDLLKTIASWPPDIQENETWKSYLLSVAILKYFLGEQWIDRHLTPDGRSGFLRQDNDEKVRSEQQSFKVVDLAELIFNLQNIDGFDGCLDRMRQGNIEPTYAELDFGRMLYVSSIDFRFVVPRGKKGDDYDIEIRLPDWPKVCADAKCKIEATNFSPETVKHTLGDARKQFPADYPSIIFVKIPSQWRAEPSPVSDVLDEVARRFLRGTKRIVSVKYFASHLRWRDGAITLTHAFKELSNPNNRFDPNRNWDLFTKADKPIQPNSRGEFSNVPQRWKRLIYFPYGVPK